MQYKNPITPVLILLLLALVWGSSFILMKRGLVVFSPVQVASMRLTFGGLALLPIALRHVRKEPLRKWPSFLIVGFLGNGIPAFLFTVAQMHLSSSVTGVLNALTPLFTLMIGVWMFNQKLSVMKVAGVVTSLIGALILILMNANGGFQADWRYGLLVVLAPVFYAISVNTVRNKLADTPPLVISALPITAVMIPSLIMLIASKPLDTFQQFESNQAWTSLICILILGLAGTAGSLIIFNRLILATSALYASSVTYLIPVVAMLWGWLDDEPVGIFQVIGMLAILTGVYLVNSKRGEAKTV